jgi:hypothetical protein
MRCCGFDGVMIAVYFAMVSAVISVAVSYMDGMVED